MILIVVAMKPDAIPVLLRDFPAPDYYLDDQSILDAINSFSQFNLLDNVGGDKVDFWLLSSDPFDMSRFLRQSEHFLGKQLQISSPEDTIIMKLRWAEMSGGSEKQFHDALSVYELQNQSLDLTYIDHWIDVFKLKTL